MFKFVLCALLAVTVAEPGVFLTPTYSESYVAPATTTITRQASSVINAHAPYYSGYPYEIAHLIKKRDIPLVSSFAAPTTYLAGAPWASPYSAYVHADSLLSPVHYSAAHLIKKRSAAPATYISTPYSSTYYGPAVLPSAYSGLWHGSPLVSAYAAPAHFIKKRSALWAPTSYVASAPLASTYLASAPFASSYSSAILPSTPYWSAYGAGFPFIKK